MLTFISKIPIFRRLFLAFTLAAVIPSIVITLLGTSLINTLAMRSQAVQNNIEAIRAVTSDDSSLDAMHHSIIALFTPMPINLLTPGLTNLKQFISTPPPFNKALYSNVRNLEGQFDTSSRLFQGKYQVATADYMSNVKAILSADDPSGQIAKHQQDTVNAVLTHFWPDYKQAMDVVLSEVKAVQTVSDAQQKTLNDRYIPLRQAWTAVLSATEKISSTVVQVGPSETNPIILDTVIAFLSTIVVIIAIGYIINLTITRPLHQLAMLTVRIARGETEARAQVVGRDEIYMVANSMNNMLDNTVRLIRQTQGQRDNLQSQVEKLVSEVSGAGEGDLRVQAEVTTDALGVLADSFNYMVEELNSLVVRVKIVADEVGSTTTAILDCMTQLVESGDIQRDQISEAAGELELTAQSSRQVAERSQILYEVARETSLNAQDGRASVQQTIQAMGRISDNVQTTSTKVQTLGDRSREINDVVDLISNIAHQTNRLALDAAIQAAMAGENGKGFGAVAADIRRLAERAKEQASTITRIVRSVREDIGAVALAMQDTEHETRIGTKLTQETGIVLESIFAVVEHQATEIEHINQMAIQQLQSSSAVVQIVQTVSESTRQNVLSTRDASQNVERLALLVKQLRASVEAFKLRGGQSVPNVNTMQEDGENVTLNAMFCRVNAAASSDPSMMVEAGNGNIEK
ncbi:MAG: HAMP domain-containing protein [Ktedonobacteraceae bacterium]|nr:HAMP domain-containing protein [Ktedonobacteraceae bacterium]